MQQIFYEAAPYAILTYPFQLEAYNTADWSGWVHVPGNLTGEQQGAVLYSYNNIDTYRFVEPVAATASTADSGGRPVRRPLIIVGVIAAVDRRSSSSCCSCAAGAGARSRTSDARDADARRATAAGGRRAAPAVV